MKQQPRKEFQMIYTKEIIMNCIERYIYKAILRQPKCKNKISPKIRDWLNNMQCRNDPALTMLRKEQKGALLENQGEKVYPSTFCVKVVGEQCNWRVTSR